MAQKTEKKAAEYCQNIRKVAGYFLDFSVAEEGVGGELWQCKAAQRENRGAWIQKQNARQNCKISREEKVGQKIQSLG